MKWEAKEPRIIAEYPIPSKSREKVVYTVSVFEDNSMICDCYAEMYNNHCSHKIIVKEKYGIEKENDCYRGY